MKLQEERRKYKQKYLARHKQPKTKSKKLSNLKFGVDLGTLNLSQYINVKRKAKQDEIKKYEQKYLARHKQQKAKPKKKAASSNLYKPEKPKPKRDVKKERKEYEQKYLARYKQPKVKPIKSSNLKSDDDLGRLNIRKHTVTKRREYQAKRKEYEKEYLTRYNKQQKAKPKKKAASSNLYKPEKPKPKRDMKKERKEYEQNYLARYNKQQKVKPKKKNN